MKMTDLKLGMEFKIGENTYTLTKFFDEPNLGMTLLVERRPNGSEYAFSIPVDFIREVLKLRKLNKHLDVYTCYLCDFEDCPERWDHYNTTGDCLHSK